MDKKILLIGIVFICLASLVSSLDDSNLVDSWNLDDNNISGSHYLNLVSGRPPLMNSGGVTGISGIQNEGWYSNSQSDILYNSSTDLDYSAHTEGTYSMWFNSSSWTQTDDTWFSISTDAIDNIANMFAIRSMADGNFQIFLKTANILRLNMIIAHPQIHNEWVNLVIKTNETDMSVWFNGENLGSNATSGYWLANMSGTWGHINFMGLGSLSGSLGKVDEINIFDVAESDEDILLLNSTFPPFVSANITLSDFNLTSGWSGASWDNESPYDTYNTTPTFTFSTSINGNCTLNGTVCSTGEGTKVHTCLFGSVLPYSMDYHNINVSCFSASNINNTNETILDVLIHSFTYLNLTSSDVGNITSQNLTCSATSVNDLINMSLYITDNQNNSFTINNTVAVTGKTNSTTWEVVLSEGNYTWGCITSDNVWRESGNHSLIIDLVSPTMTVHNTSFFSLLNTTILSNIDILSLKLINLTFTDDRDLFYYQINITNSSPYNLYSTGGNLSGITETISKNLNLSNWTIDTYLIEIDVWDSHTKQEIGDYHIKEGMNYIKYDNTIKITANNAIISTTTKKRDRYEFKFNYLPFFTPEDKIFYVESDNKLTYIIESNYEAHFVDFKNEKWIDFNGLDQAAKVYKVNDYKYKIVFEGNQDKTIVFNSIGSLNKGSAAYKFDIDNEAPILKWITPLNNISSMNPNGSIFLSLNVTDANRNETIFFVYNSSGQVFNHSMINEGSSSYLYNHSFIDLTGDTYYVNATHTDQLNISNSTDTLIFFRIGIDNCSTYTTNSMNFTILNVSSSGEISSETEFYITFNSTDYLNNSVNGSYSVSMDGSNFTFCIYPNTSIISTDFWITYSNSGDSYDYFTDQTKLTNVSQSINLYIQDGTYPIRFRVTQYSGDDAVVGAYIKILRFDVGEGTYKTVEILKTDSEGYATGNLIYDSIWYKFIIVFDGETKLETTPEQFPSGTTTRYFRINLDETWYTNYNTARGVEGSVVFNELTDNFRFTYNDPSGVMHYGCLKVVKTNSTGRYEINNTCVLSTASTILQHVSIKNGTYTATGYLMFDDEVVIDTATKSWASTWHLYDKDKEGGMFTTFMIVLTLAGAGIWSPIVGVILTLVGIIFSVVIGLYSMGMGALIILIILSIIILVKVSRR